MSLTPDQEQAKQAVLCFLNDPTQQCFVLQGFAGVGKTYLIQHVEHAYAALSKLHACTGTEKPKKWYYTATTHKAAQALQTATSMATCTIHSLLRLRLQTDYSKGVRQLTGTGSVAISDGIIVIDEASYIDYALLVEIQANCKDSKIIFMGDPTQLTPVGLNHAPVFLAGFPTYALTQVVRQSTEHPLSPILGQFRDFISGKSSQFPKIKACPELVRLTRPDMLEQIKAEFSNPAWESHESRILAWRNKTVQTYNNLLFTAANQRKEYAVGDILMNNHTLPKLRTDEEVQILSGAFKTTSCGISGTWYSVAGAAGTTSVFVPDKQSDYVRTKNKMVRAKNYKAVQTIMDTWADLRPPYASTMNKAQGCTFNRVYIDLDDMRGIKDTNQLARLLYVAMSRAKHQVIFVGDL